jgi:hypothetical protein
MKNQESLGQTLTLISEEIEKSRHCASQRHTVVARFL